jgi:hypothetical protein
MSQENVEIMRSADAALAEHGVEAVLAYTDPQFGATTPSSLQRDGEHVVKHERQPFGGSERLDYDEQRYVWNRLNVTTRQVAGQEW